MRTRITFTAALALFGITFTARAQVPPSYGTQPLSPGTYGSQPLYGTAGAQPQTPPKATKEPLQYEVECRVFHVADLKHQATSLNVLTAPRLTITEGKQADVRIADDASLKDADANAARPCECSFAFSAKVEKLKPRKLVKLEAKVEMTTKSEAGKGGVYAVGKSHADRYQNGKPASLVRRDLRAYEALTRGLPVTGSCQVSKAFRLVEQLKCGQTVMVVLEAEDNGTPRTWAEVTVREVNNRAELLPLPSAQ